jgi:hypothetical protein
LKLLALALLSGCILPVSTGAPLPATTVGQGKFGFAMSGEAPTLNLISKNDNYSDTYAAAPAAAATLTLSYGLGDHTDLELAGEGALYWFFLPMPTGGSAGLRQHFDVGDTFDVALAAKIGGVTMSDTSTTTINGSSTTSNDSASAIYGAFQGVIATKHGVARPLISLSIMPFRIKRHLDNEPEVKFKGEGSSLTAGIQLVGSHFVATPYVAVTNFQSETFSGGWFVSGGILLAFRRDRNRAPDVIQVLPVPAQPTPGYYPPPPVYNGPNTAPPSPPYQPPPAEPPPNE